MSEQENFEVLLLRAVKTLRLANNQIETAFMMAPIALATDTLGPLMIAHGEICDRLSHVLAAYQEANP